MFKRLLLGFFLCVAGATAAFAQCAPLPFTLTNGTIADANQVMANFNAVNTCAQSGTPLTATNATLGALLTASVPNDGVIRLGFTVKGDAPAVLFVPENGTCAGNSRVNDGGSCVNTTSGDGNSFYAVYPASGADIREWGAKCDASTNDSAAMTAAATWAGTAGDKGAPIVVPAATCLMNAVIANLNGVTIQGTGSSSILSPASGASAVLTLQGGSRDTVQNLQILGGAFGAGDGIVMQLGQGDSKLKNIVVAKFPGRQIACIGTVGTPLSGNDVLNSYALNPQVAVAGIFYSFCNDFHIIDNQAGVISVATFSSGNGIDLENSLAGQVAGNFIWQNNVGLIANNSKYDWIVRNRLTQSGAQNALIENSTNINFNHNQAYQGSNVGVGTDESVKFLAVIASQIGDNQFFDWTGVHHVNYHLTVDATSSSIDIHDNYYDNNFTINYTNISASATQVNNQNNLPHQVVNTNNAIKAYFSGITPQAGIGGGAISTIFLGPTSSSAESVAQITAPVDGVVDCFSFQTTVAPLAAETWTYTFRVNGGASTLTTTQTTGQFTAGGCFPTLGVSIGGLATTMDMQVVASGASNLAAVAWRGGWWINQ